MKKIIYMLMSLLLLVAGCTSQAQDSQTEIQQDNTITQDTSAEIIREDTKTETQKSEESILTAIEDGVYETQKTYKYHEGTEIIDISITVEDGIISAASVTSVGYAHKVSQKFITGVNDGLQDLVVGKSVSEAEVPDQISGSSLTTGVFKEYLTEIKNT